MRLPSARAHFLAFLVPFLGVTLTFNGTGIAARRASSNQSSRTRVTRSLRATVGHEWDVIHEEPDKRWSRFEALPESAFKPFSLTSLPAVNAATPPRPRLEMVELLPPEPKRTVVSSAPSVSRGRSPPSLS